MLWWFWRFGFGWFKLVAVVWWLGVLVLVGDALLFVDWWVCGLGVADLDLLGCLFGCCFVWAVCGLVAWF